MTDQATDKQDEASSKYLIIPYWLIQNTALSWTERIVFAYIKSWDDDNKLCFGTSEHMAERLGISQRQIFRAKKTLLDLGLVVLRRGRGNQEYLTTKLDISDPKMDYDKIQCDKDGSVVYDKMSQCDRNGSASYDKMAVDYDKMSQHYDKMSYHYDKLSESPDNARPAADNKTDTLPSFSTGQNSPIIRSIIRSIKRDIKESTPPPPNTPEWYLVQAEKALEKATGEQPWERNNAYMLAGRRPMTKYPLLWFTPMELAKAVEIILEALPPEADYKAVFDLAQSEATQRLVKHGKAEINAMKYVTGFCLQQVTDTLRKSNYLQNSRSK
jgi:hypothetical protein